MRPLDFSLDGLREIVEARGRLEEGVEGKSTVPSRPDSAEFAERADEPCVKLRVQLEYAEDIAVMLDRLSGRRQPRAGAGAGA